MTRPGCQDGDPRRSPPNAMPKRMRATVVLPQTCRSRSRIGRQSMWTLTGLTIGNSRRNVISSERLSSIINRPVRVTGCGEGLAGRRAAAGSAGPRVFRRMPRGDPVSMVRSRWVCVIHDAIQPFAHPAVASCRKDGHHVRSCLVAAQPQSNEPGPWFRSGCCPHGPSPNMILKRYRTVA